MHYTVIINSPVPVEQRGRLAGQLLALMGGKIDDRQAEKLAAKHTGPLIKPNTKQERAELLFDLFASYGADVSLMQVSEDGREREPIPRRRPALVDDLADEAAAFMAPMNPAPVDPPAAPTSAASAVEGPAPSVPAVSPPDSAPGGMTFSDFTSSLAVPAPASAPGLTGLGGNYDELTGSLTLPGQGGNPLGRDSQTARPPAVWEQSDLAAGMADATGRTTLVDEDAALPKRRRQPLRTRLLVQVLIPLALTTLVIVGFLLAYLPAQQARLIQQGAQATAAAVGSGVNVANADQLYNQLSSLTAQADVGFVNVETATGEQLFAGRDEAAGPVLSQQLTAFLRDNPQGGSFSFSAGPASLAQAQVQALESAGVPAGSAALAEARKRAQQPGAPVQTSYQVVRVGVYQLADAKVIGPIGGVAGAQPLYRVAVGVVSDASQRVVNQTTALIVLVALTALIVASVLATQTARRIVEPIQELVRAADEISYGKLDHEVRATHNDEVGDLAESLNRMRLSLDAAMVRLRKRNRRESNN